jgi:biopolymer transport protein TolR
LRINGLKTKLEAIFATRKNKQVYIQADAHVDYGAVAEVMGEIRAAGIFSIGLITLPKAGSQ